MYDSINDANRAIVEAISSGQPVLVDVVQARDAIPVLAGPEKVLLHAGPPIRFEDMAKRNAIPADVLAKLPDTTGAVFPTLDQLNKATELITKNWDSVVGADIK